MAILSWFELQLSINGREGERECQRRQRGGRNASQQKGTREVSAAKRYRRDVVTRLERKVGARSQPVAEWRSAINYQEAAFDRVQ